MSILILSPLGEDLRLSCSQMAFQEDLRSHPVREFQTVSTMVHFTAR
jgi:hypothetical protein